MPIRHLPQERSDCSIDPPLPGRPLRGRVRGNGHAAMRRALRLSEGAPLPGQLRQDGVGRLDARLVGVVAIGQHNDADPLAGTKAT